MSRETESSTMQYLVFLEPSTGRYIRVDPGLVEVAENKGWEPADEMNAGSSMLIECWDCRSPFISPDGGIALNRCPPCNEIMEQKSRELAQKYPGTQGDGMWCG